MPGPLELIGQEPVTELGVILVGVDQLVDQMGVVEVAV